MTADDTAADRLDSTDWIGRRVLVCFNYDTGNAEPGVIVRDDPGMTIVIQLDTGRVVFGTECQYRLL